MRYRLSIFHPCNGRSAGMGRVISIVDVESAPNYPVAQYMNFSKESLDNVLASLHWAMVDSSYEPGQYMIYMMRNWLIPSSNSINFIPT